MASSRRYIFICVHLPIARVLHISTHGLHQIRILTVFYQRLTAIHLSCHATTPHASQAKSNKPRQNKAKITKTPFPMLDHFIFMQNTLPVRSSNSMPKANSSFFLILLNGCWCSPLCSSLWSSMSRTANVASRIIRHNVDVVTAPFTLAGSVIISSKPWLLLIHQIG